MTTTKELRELLTEGSAGPWDVDEDDAGIESANGGCVCYVQRHGSYRTVSRTGEEWSRADQRLIAAMRNTLPGLLAVCEAVASDDCLVLGHGEESSNFDERTCGLCGESQRAPFLERFKHADDCAWVAARKLCGEGA